MIETPHQRMLERIRQGKVESELQWCNEVLNSTDPRSRCLKGFALVHKMRLLPPGKGYAGSEGRRESEKDS